MATAMELLPKSRGLLTKSRSICRGCSQSLRARRTSPASSRSFASTSTSPDIYDVVCIGGGPAGLSLLAALRSNPITSRLRVALVEAQDLTSLRKWSLPPTAFSNRCSSLTPVSARYLDRIGAWKHLDQSRVQSYQEMQVWDGITGARIEFDGPHQEPGQDGTIAYMTENLNLTSGLLRRLDELGGVNLFDKASVSDIALGEDTSSSENGWDLSMWPVVQLSTGKKLWARLLVGADGANSPVRKFAEIPTRGWDYDRHGVVATLEHDGVIGGAYDRKVAYQRFLPTGPVALLPLPGNMSTLVWSTTPANAAALKKLSTPDFLALVNAAFRLDPVDIAYMHTIPSGQTDELTWRLQHTPLPTSPTASISSLFSPVRNAPSATLLPPSLIRVQDGSIASFPLRLRHADRYVGERVALVGDAAHTIHPLAGQGLNQGQGDVSSLAAAIASAASHGLDIGTQLSLESYSAERYAANHMMLGVCDKLHKLYSIQSGPLVGMRSLGLRAVNAMGPLKDFLMKQAAGEGVKV